MDQRMQRGGVAQQQHDVPAPGLPLSVPAVELAAVTVDIGGERTVFWVVLAK